MVRTVKPNLAQEQMQQGIAAFILARSVPLIDLDDRSNGGSGVLLQLNKRYFVATAAHVIEPDHQYAILMRSFDKKYDEIIGRHFNSNHDIGALELNEKSVDKLTTLGHCFLTLEHLYVDRYPHGKMPIRIVGFPSDKQTREIKSRKISRKATMHEIVYASLSYNTFTLPRRRWPNLSSEFRKCQPLKDIFCSWDPHEDGTRFNLENITDAPQPHRFGPMELRGMSGGGIWIPFEENNGQQISTPAALLAGIQNSYSEDGKKKWLRGTQTKVLVRFFEELFPSLIRREIIPSRRGLSLIKFE